MQCNFCNTTFVILLLFIHYYLNNNSKLLILWQKNSKLPIYALLFFIYYQCLSTVMGTKKRIFLRCSRFINKQYSKYTGKSYNSGQWVHSFTILYIILYVNNILSIHKTFTAITPFRQSEREYKIILLSTVQWFQNRSLSRTCLPFHIFALTIFMTPCAKITHAYTFDSLWHLKSVLYCEVEN